MKSVSLIILISILSVFQLWGQDEVVLHNKFTLIMPEEWQHKPKIIANINDILAAHIEEFEDKQFCLKCLADYTVKFQIANYRLIDKDYIKLSENNYIGETMFSFKGSMLIFDKQDRALVSLVLIDTFAVQKAKYNFSTKEPVETKTVNSRDLLIDNSGLPKPFSSSEKIDGPDDIIRKQPPPSYADFLIAFEGRIKVLGALAKRDIGTKF